jgi:hypothetical protein
VQALAASDDTTSIRANGRIDVGRSCGWAVGTRMRSSIGDAPPRPTNAGAAAEETEPDPHIPPATLRAVNLAGFVALASSAVIVYGAWSIVHRSERDRSLRPGVVWAVMAALIAGLLVIAGLAWPSAFGGVLLGALVGLTFVFRSRRVPRDDL